MSTRGRGDRPATDSLPWAPGWMPRLGGRTDCLDTLCVGGAVSFGAMDPRGRVHRVFVRGSQCTIDRLDCTRTLRVYGGTLDDAPAWARDGFYTFAEACVLFFDHRIRHNGAWTLRWFSLTPKDV